MAEGGELKSPVPQADHAPPWDARAGRDRVSRDPVRLAQACRGPADRAPVPAPRFPVPPGLRAAHRRANPP